jgi:hypothetical protein
MSQEEETRLQVQLETQIEVLETRLSNWMDKSRPDFVRMVERKQLLQRELELSKLRQALKASAETEPTDKPGNQREVFVRSLLEEKGFSVHDWASRANVDFHTADDYLKGKTNPYPTTRKKLADALGVEVTKLPR